MQHVFRYCSVEILTWKNCPLRIDPLENVLWSLQKWVRRYILLFHSADGWNGGGVCCFLALMWSPWGIRNARVFKEVGGHPGEVLALLQDHMKHVDLFITRNEARLVEGPLKPPGFHMVHLGK